MLKFSIPDSKQLVVVDCGNKIHLTDFDRPIAPAPSSFVSKLRKHLKSRRLSIIRKVENDRILVFQFSDGEYYLVFEFFSAGNVLLLDRNLRILALQRLVKDLGPNHATYATNETYRSFVLLLFDPVKENEKLTQSPDFTALQALEWIQIHRKNVSEKNNVNKKVFSINKLLFINASHLSNDLILKTLLDNKIESSRSCLELENDPHLLAQTVAALNETKKSYEKLLGMGKSHKTMGYIVQKKNPLHKPDERDSLEYVYDEFHPFEPYKKSEDYCFEIVEGYNRTIDRFFSAIESTKHSLRIEQQKQHAQKRLDNARNEKNRQIEQLVNQQEANERKGEAILYHAEAVEACSEYVNEMLKKQMDWTDIENLIKFDAARKKSEALAIRLPLQLENNIIKLSVVDPSQVDDQVLFNNSTDSAEDSSSYYDSESDYFDSDHDSDDSHVKKLVKLRTKKTKAENAPRLVVNIDLTQSAFANASFYFGQKKEASSKQAKVEKKSDLAMKNAEKRVERDLAKKLRNEADTLKNIRHKYWFEKFFWFVTSEGYLCLAGRDEIQTDMIYYRYFGDDSFFVSSDVEGALKVFVLNPYPTENVSPTTIFQAGVFSLLTSNAWNAKVSSSSWWLKGNDVTKIEFDGSLLGPGRLNYKAAKNYMPPAQLVMGFGFYWLGDEETSKKHTAARFKRQQEYGLKVKVNRKKADLEGMDLEKMSISSSKKFQESFADAEERKNESTDADVELSTEVNTEPEEKLILSSLAPSKMVRGKRGKLKKQKARYSHQDEEERKLRIEALGTLKHFEALQKQKMEEQQRRAETTNKKYNQESTAAQRERRAEERELLKYLDADEDDFDESYLAMLDSFVAKPSKEDVVATAVPIFAPWAALAKFKYKVKVQPGMGKKGKSLAEAYAYFSKRKVDTAREDVDEDWPEEHKIINSLSSADAIGILTVSKLKMMMPAQGGNNAKKGAKKSK